MGGVKWERMERVCVVTLDRPERRNAVDPETAQGLRDAFAAFEDDPELDVAVLTGSGGNFCSGFDLTAVGAGVELDPRGSGPMGPTRARLMKPVVAAVEGYAVAGGLELALWCDLRVASDTAVFGVFCRRWGVPLIDGGTVRLPRLIGEGRALDMILTGRPVGADEALSWGLVDRRVAPGKALAAALELATRLSAFPQTCLRSDRRATLGQWGLEEAAALAAEAAGGLEALSRDGVAGAARFRDGQGRGGSGV